MRQRLILDFPQRSTQKLVYPKGYYEAQYWVDHVIIVASNLVFVCLIQMVI